MALQIVSSARVKSPYAHIIEFGEQDVGKTMTLATAPDPLWILTEPTRLESLTQENIEAVYGRPTREELTDWLKKEKKLKGKELETALADPASEVEMTGITYDMPRIDVFDYKSLSEALEFIRSPAGKKYKTLGWDSATKISEIVLNHYQNQKSKAGNKMDGRLAYGKAGREVYEFFKEILEIPKHSVFICHASEFQHNIGTVEEPLWQRELYPTFHGNFLKREVHHLISNIFQVVKGRKGDNGSVLYVDDSGNSIRTLRCRPDTQKGVERTLCPRINGQEDTNLTELFAKLTQA